MKKIYKLICFLSFLILPLNCFAGVEVSTEPNIYDNVNIIAIDKVENLIINELQNNGLAEELEISIRNHKKGVRLKNKSAKYYMEIADLKISKNSRRFDAKINFKSDQQSESVIISGRYDELVPVPVVSTNVPKGTTISESYIEWINTKKHLLKHDTIRDEQQIIGKAAKRTISAHRPIRITSLDLPALVFRNETVNFTYASGPIKLKTVAVALDEGGIGQIIRVRNPDSKKIVKAVVTDRKLVTAL